MVDELKPAVLVLLPADAWSPGSIYLRARETDSSRRAMRHALKKIAAYLCGPGTAPEAVPWHLLRRPETSAIRAELIARVERRKGDSGNPGPTMARATANQYLCALRGVLHECWALGLTSTDDYMRASDLKSLKGHQLPAGRDLSLAELAALAEVCAADGSGLGARDAAVIALLAGCGLRRSEVARLELGQVDLSAGSLVVRAGKRGKDRRVPLVPGVPAALRDWLPFRPAGLGAPLLSRARRGGRELVARGITPEAVRDVCRRRGKQAGLVPFTAHDLRRTCATRMLDACADLRAVQEILGHASPETTARYDLRGFRELQRQAGRLVLPFRPVPRSVPRDDRVEKQTAEHPSGGLDHEGTGRGSDLGGSEHVGGDGAGLGAEGGIGADVGSLAPEDV